MRGLEIPLIKKGPGAVLEDLIQRRPDLAVCRESIEQAWKWMGAAHRAGGKFLLCGNGGSAGDSAHWMGELVKGFGAARPLEAKDAAWFRQKGPDGLGALLAEKLQQGFRAVDLTAFGSSLTAIANDNDAALIFAQLVVSLGRPGDLLIAFTTSGNSRNILAALSAARCGGLKSILLTGPAGGKARAEADLTIAAPGRDTPLVQEAHLPIYHALSLMLEAEFFG